MKSVFLANAETLKKRSMAIQTWGIMIDGF